MNRHTPTRALDDLEPVVACRIIRAPASAVWSVLATPGQLTRYHPYCSENRVIHWPGRGSRDGVRYLSGLYFERDFVSWSEGVGYDVQVGPPPRKSCFVSWRIAALSGTDSEMILRLTPLLESRLAGCVKSAYLERYFGASVQLYLDHLLRGLEQFVMTGRTVGKKQFGPHPLYAP